MTGNGFTFSSARAGKKTLHKALSLLLAGSLIFSNLHVYAEDIRADASAPGAQQPAVLQAANGVPQVNIKTPNSAGLSHNSYSAFDIDPRGVILNNSRTDVNTQLGGFVTANPEMAGGEARVILNEINSNKRSDINGFIEIAGKRADVIVANPSGISCKNCGFINAQQGTLTTGEVRFNGGQIEGYKVEQGSIELNGFNAEDADYASIISRAVEINGDVRAQELRVTTGLNTVDAANLSVQRDTATATAAPQFSLDVKALGGMYAGKITLIGTEDGVGVRNAGKIGATASELVIRDGQLMNSGTLSSTAGMQLDIAGTLDNSSIINGGDLTLDASELKNTGSITAEKTLTVEAGPVTNSGDISSKQHLDISAGQSINNLVNGRMIGGSATLTADTGSVTNSGEISSQQHLNIQANQSIENNSGRMIGDSATLTADTGPVTNSGEISSTQHLNIHTDTGINNQINGRITADSATLTAESGPLTNAGEISSNQHLEIHANQSISNQINGRMTGDSATLTAATGQVTNAGDISSQQHLKIYANQSITNQTDGRMIGDSATLTADTGPLTNAGEISSLKHLNIHAKQSITNQINGRMTGDSATLTADTGSVTNAGEISSTQHLNIQADTGINNQPSGWMTGGSATLTADTGPVTNAGDIGSTRHLNIRAHTAVNNQPTGRMTGGSATLIADTGSVTNAGDIGSQQHLSIHASQSINNNDGEIIGSSATLTAKTILNQGADALIAATDATQKLSLHVSDSLINKEKALIYSKGNLSVDGQVSDNLSEDTAAQQLTNLSATIEALGDISFKLDQLLNESLGHSEITTETTTETVQMRIPSWLTNGSNGDKGVNKIATTSNYSPYVTYLLHPHDLLEKETLYTPSGEQVYKVKVRLRSNDTVFFRATGCTYGRCETRKRLKAKDTTKVLYLTSISIGQANPDQVSTPDIWGGYNSATKASTRKDEIVYQNTFGNCTTDCVRLTQPYKYENPRTTIARNAMHHVLPKKPKLERSRVAVHSITRDIQDTSQQGAKALVVAGGKLTAAIGKSLDNKFSILSARGDLTITGVGSDAELTNHAKSLFEQHTFNNTTTAFDGTKEAWVNPERTVKADSIKSVISSGGKLTTTDIKVNNEDLGAGVANPTDRVIIVGEAPAPGQALAPLNTAPTLAPLTLNSSLFTYDATAPAGYVIETDPRFTDKKQWLSSDYILSRVALDPGVTQKRLGDGFYEQQRLREQLVNLTGKRFVGEHPTDDAMFQALMQEGVNYATEYNLRPGIALTAEQMARLTSDIIWLEEEQVTLPNGEVVAALVPNVYLAPATVAQNLATGGALITANTVDLKVTSLQNQGGSIVADERLSLIADTDIINRGGTVTGKRVDLSAGRDINNETLSVERRFESANSTGSYKEQSTAISQRGKITSTGGNLSLNAGRDILNQGATIQAQGDLDLRATGDITFNTVKTGREIQARVGRDGSRVSSQSGNTRSTLTSTGDTTLNATNVELTALAQQSGGDLAVTAENDLTVTNAFNKSKQESKYTNHLYKGDSTTVVSTTLDAGNVSLKSGADTRLQAAKVNAQGTIEVAAGEDLEISSAASERYQYAYSKSKKSFGRKKVSTREKYSLDHIGTELNAGADILINSERNDEGEIIRLDSGKTTVSSSHLNAQDQLVINADEGIELTSRKNIDYEKRTTKKSGLLGLTRSSSGSVKRRELLSQNRLATRQDDLSLLSGADVTIIASDLESAADLNLEAADNVLITAANESSESQEWDVSGGFLTGGSFYSLESEKSTKVTNTAKSATLDARGDVDIDAGSATVIGSQINADGNITVNTDVGSVEVLSAVETGQSTSESKKITVSFVDALKNLAEPHKLITVDDGKLKLSLAKATYDQVDTEGKNLSQKASTLTAGGNINLDSAESITVTGSDLAAGVERQGEPDATGDVNLTARDGDITINESVDSLASIRQEVHAIAEVSAVVEHKSVEIVKALQSLKKAKEKLQQAKRDYRQYKKDRTRIKAELAGLEQDYVNKVPGVSYDDLIEVRDLSEDLESDKDWYIAGIALASVDVATKGTALAYQVDAASRSRVTWGFDAGLQLDIEGSKSERNRQTSTANASTLSGDNITINTGLSTEEGQSKTTIRGSHLAANDTITINTGELNAEASQSTSRAHNSKESFSTSISQTLHGAATGGVAVSGSYSRSKDDQKSTTYENSTITADQVTLNSRGDTNIKGANIRGNEVLDVDVGGDLQVESRQNRNSGSNKSLGIEAGFSTGGTAGSEGYAQSAGEFADRVADTASEPGKYLGGDATGSLSAANGGLNAGSGRFTNRQTVESSLTGGEVNVDVAGHTQLNGAVIAATDEKGADTGNLELNTQSFGFEDLTNRSYSTQRSAGITAGVNVATESNTGKDGNVTEKGDTAFDSGGVEYENTSGYRKTKTLATLGSGDITIRDDQDNGTDSTERLNRDVTNTGKSLVDIRRQQGNFDVTITEELLAGGIATVVGNYAEQQVQAAEALKKLAEKLQETDPEQAQALRDQVQAINDDWDETGTFRVALHTITGALTGDLRGAATALATAYTIPELSNKLQGIDGLDTESRERILTLVAGSVGAVGGGAIGAADSVNQTVNNYLSHQQAERKDELFEQLANCQGAECQSINEELAAIDALDKLTDVEFTQACADQTSSDCSAATGRMLVALGSYDDQNLGVEGKKQLINMAYRQLPKYTLESGQKVAVGVVNQCEGATCVQGLAFLDGLTISYVDASRIKDPEVKAVYRSAQETGEVAGLVLAVRSLPNLLEAGVSSVRKIGKGPESNGLDSDLQNTNPSNPNTNTAGSNTGDINLGNGSGIDSTPTINLERGTKGDWNKIANNPEPNTKYEFDNGYSYKTDPNGRVDTVEADLQLGAWDRNRYQQRISGGECRGPNDCGGHLIASMFGGPGERVNLVPMDGKLNGSGGEWYKLEQQWKGVLEGGGSVKVNIKPSYSGDSARPDSFSVRYSINGVTQPPKVLQNTPTGQ
ncbi:two-partner secretion domain-containing protein [Aliamphritea hakodatensis]|uniref:two-partner secretion domain-containing protein n=1 Tax=Aliamphritea hakodatensis TaxID=2895352 RepID=UPI0022FD4D02|nr:hemagglutinin repeat-containing protein [Aliamphritea hakodatensis]